MKKIIFVIILVIALVLVLAINQILYLRKAHSSFENYYAFRACNQLIKRTDTYGICKLSSGKEIKIVKYQNKWYLDGDLPWACLGGICFGI